MQETRLSTAPELNARRRKHRVAVTGPLLKTAVTHFKKYDSGCLANSTDTSRNMAQDDPTHGSENTTNRTVSWNALAEMQKT